MRPPELISTCFGPNSLAAHLRQANRAGIAWTEIEPGGAALDVDTPEDLMELQRQLRDGRTSARATRETLRAVGL